MLVEQIPVNNALRNYMYIITCPVTLEAAAVDPLDHRKCLQRAKELGWTIKSVINTHEHHDHIGGNQPVIEATGAKLYAHKNAVDKIEDVNVPLNAGDRILIGSDVELVALDTPGHTFCHTCLLFEGNQDTAPALFSGDTLFNAGVGNCFNGGDPEALYNTFAEQIFTLSGNTNIYPGHDYIVNNLMFTLNREPDNHAASSLLTAMQQWPADAKHYISNIGVERNINAFFRLKSQSLIAELRKQFPDLPEQLPEKTVFIKLRELRDKW